MAKAAGHNTAASPALITGGGGPLEGQRATHLVTRAPSTERSRHQNRRPRKDRPKPWLQGGLSHRATMWHRSQLRKKETGQQDPHCARGTKMRGKTPALRHITKPSNPPWEAEAMLQHLCRGLKGKHTHTHHTHTNNKQGMEGEHTHTDAAFQQGRIRRRSQLLGINPHPRATYKSLRSDPGGCTEATDLNVPRGFSSKDKGQRTNATPHTPSTGLAH